MGDDTLTGGASNDLLQGDAGGDFLAGGTGDDTLLGGDDNDRLTGSAGADVMDGGTDDDLVSYSGKVTVDLAIPSNSTGFALGDTFAGIEGIGFLNGTGSRFVGNATSLSVLLLGGSMTALAGSGAETFVANSGNMSVSYVNTPVTGVSFSFVLGQMTGSRGALGDKLEGVSSLTLTGRNDVFDATGFNGFRPLPSTILAGNGSDALVLKHSGVSTIDTGSGNDTVSGQMSSGTLALGSGTDTVNLLVQGISDPILFVTAGSGNDNLTIEGLNAALNVQGEAGNDTIVLNDLVFLSSHNVDGGDGNDTITASGGASVVAGGLDDDSLAVTAMTIVQDVSGGDGNDTIVVSGPAGSAQGGNGNDDMTFHLFLTGAGTAILDGGAGDDTLTMLGEFPFGTSPPGNGAEFHGGAGNDTLVDMTPLDGANAPFVLTQFVFSTGWGNDTVTGFEDGADTIRFDGTAGAGLDEFTDVAISGNATQTLITFGADTILLSGLDIALFTAADVTFA